jgi:hypothetical protein
LTLSIHYIEEEKETMKKLVLILSAIVVLVAFAVPVFAAEMYDPEQRMAKLYEEKAAVLKASGEFTFGGITSFDAATANQGFANFYVDFTIWPDEYNSILLEIAGDTWASPVSLTTIAYFELTTDVGAYFGLPVGLKNTAGRTSLYTNKYEVTGHAYERDTIRTDIDPLAWKFMVDAGMAQATAAIGFGEGSDTLNDLGIYVFVPDIAGLLEAELWYIAEDDADMKGKFGLSAKATGIMDMLGVALGFVFDTRDAAVPEWAFGVGVKADLDVGPAALGIGVSLDGNDVDTLNKLAVDADANFGDLGLVGTVALNFAELPDETFYGAEISAYVKVGAAKWSVGYTIANDAFGADGRGYYNYTSAVESIDGGLFVNADIDF